MSRLTGLTLDAVKRAKACESFQNPLLLPQSVDLEQLERVAQQQGFRVLVGDRFSHLLGSGAGKGRATRWLIERYLTSLSLSGHGWVRKQPKRSGNARNRRYSFNYSRTKRSSPRH